MSRFARMVAVLFLAVFMLSSVSAQTDRVRALIFESRMSPMFLLSPDGTQLAVCESPILWGPDAETTPFPQEALRLWLVDLTQDEPTFRILQGHTDMIASADYAEDGSVFVTHHRNGEFIFWDTATGDILRRIRTPLFTGAQSAPFTYIAEREQIIPAFTATTLAPSAVIMDAMTGELRYLLPRILNYNDIQPTPSGGEFTSISAPVLANSAIIAATLRGNIWRFDIATGEAEQLVLTDEEIPTLPYRRIISTSAGIFNQQVYLLRQGREEELNGLYTLDVQSGAMENVVPEAQVVTYDAAEHRLVWAGEDIRVLNIAPADDPANAALTLNLDAETLAEMDLVFLSGEALAEVDFGSIDLVRPSFVSNLNLLQMQNNRLVLGTADGTNTGLSALLIVDVSN
ncbi:MAG: hypothetical protein OHK0046_49150 [Anaerolineae bacterium]